MRQFVAVPSLPCHQTLDSVPSCILICRAQTGTQRGRVHVYRCQLIMSINNSSLLIRCIEMR